MGLIAGNFISFWKHETLSIPVADGFDEIALALNADAWSRTYRSQAITTSGKITVRSRHGLVLVPDQKSDTAELPFDRTLAPAKSLDTALDEIAARYGRDTADLVALQLEYTRGE